MRRHPSRLVWLHWFASDALGTLTVAPLVIGLASLMRNVPSTREAAESALALAVVCVLCAFLVFLPNRPWTLELATIALCPLFVWIAARLPPGIASAATFICAITIVSTTTFAIGIFGDSRLSFEQRIQSAQASILAISFGALVLTALFSERRLQGDRTSGQGGPAPGGASGRRRDGLRMGSRRRPSASQPERGANPGIRIERCCQRI